MLIDLLTNNTEILDFVKKGHGGREENGEYFSLINIPAGFPEDFISDIDTFIAEKRISLEEYGYIIYNINKMIVKASGKIR